MHERPTSSGATLSRLGRFSKRLNRIAGLLGGDLSTCPRWLVPTAAHPPAQTIEIEIDYRGRVQRESLRDEQPANDGDAEWAAQFRPGSKTQRDRQPSKQSSHGRHHDWAESEQTCFVDGIEGAFALAALRLEGEVDHHDRVFLDDPDQKDDADDGDHGEIVTE